MNEEKAFRWFTGSLAFIILGAALIFLWRSQHTEYRADDSPENVVFNYILAVQRKDANKIFKLLADEPSRPSVAFIQSYLNSNQMDIGYYVVEITGSNIYGDQAFVALRIQENRGPFSDSYAYHEQVTLRRENGVWRIVSMPWQLEIHDYEGEQP